MQIKPTSFTVDTSDSSSFFDSQNQLARTVRSSVQPGVIIPCFENVNHRDNYYLAIPSASLVTFDLKFTRVGTGTGSCGSKIIITIGHFKLITIIIICLILLTARNIDFQGGIDTSQDDSGANTNVYINTINPSNSSAPTSVRNENRYQFTTSDSAAPSNSNELYLGLDQELLVAVVYKAGIR